MIIHSAFRIYNFAFIISHFEFKCSVLLLADLKPAPTIMENVAQNVRHNLGRGFNPVFCGRRTR